MSGFEFQTQLAQRRAANLYRIRRIVEGPQTVEGVVDGRPCLSFCSNDYLGLANHPEVITAFKAAADRYGVGGGASHLVNGHFLAHHALEEELADFVGRPRALLFSTGYMANLGVIGALLGRSDTVFEDRLNHASLIDGGLLSRARFVRYQHGDPGDLKERLNSAAQGRHLVVTDGVFSMDGDLAPLPQLARVTRDSRAWLMVDDAHGFGILGEGGRGSLEYFELGLDEVPVLVGTLGKACGTTGAFVAGSDDLIEMLIQQARPYIYTTALPPAVAEATRVSLRLIAQEAWRRERLRALIARFRSGAAELGLKLMDSPTPIQPLLVGDAAQAVRLSDALWRHGLLITAIRPPTVPQGSARLRITLSAAHTETQVDRLLGALDEATREYPDAG